MGRMSPLVWAHLDTPTGKEVGRVRPGKPQPRSPVSKGTTLRLAGTDAPYLYQWVYQDALPWFLIPFSAFPLSFSVANLG